MGEGRADGVFLDAQADTFDDLLGRLFAIFRAGVNMFQVFRSLASTAIRTFSKTVSLGKTFTTWNERDIPFLQIS